MLQCEAAFILREIANRLTETEIKDPVECTIILDKLDRVKEHLISIQRSFNGIKSTTTVLKNLENSA